MKPSSNKWVIFILFAICIIVLYLVYSSTESIENMEDSIDMNYYVISMQSEERMQNIKNQQAKMSTKINVFDAINGDNVDLDNVPNQIIADEFKENSKHRKREIGCFLSHYGLLQKIQSDGNRDGYTVIFEDDFNIIIDNFEETVESTLKSMKNTTDFDIMYIETISNNIGENVRDDICKIDMDKDLYGTQAYIVKNSNIDKLLNVTWIVDMPIDWKYSTAVKSNKIVAYTFCPFLTRSTDLESTLF
jgi:GR25 family glycosyltransferase involved in LPS biosynthesis